ncbi:MAG TPA: CpsD/CapB family tyrosine-protein kinase [Actinomyces sp.]|nr:CpsD/CapB family tyrosine-protein kinase [Actinomyces sp.]
MAAKGVIVWLSEPFETEVIQELNAQSAKFSVQRRCADLTETRACVRAGLGSIVIAEGGASGLDASVVDEFHAADIFVLLVHDDPVSAPSMGEDARCDRSSGKFVVETLTLGIRNRMLGMDEPPPPAPAQQAPVETDYEGRMIAVWGTSGAPGRSTIAVNLAHALAVAGRPVTVVDADAHAPSLAHMLGFDAPESGLLSASVLRNQGELSTSRLDDQRIAVEDGFNLLSGLTRADRWRSLRPEAINEVLRELRKLGDVVVDLSDGLADDDPSQLTFVPTPQDINRDILDQADQFIVVARADAVGLTRLAHTLFDAEENGLRPQLLVINKARRSGTGGSIERPIDSVLSSIVPDIPRVIIEDAAVVDQATLDATTVVAQSPSSSFVEQINQVLKLMNLVGAVTSVDGGASRGKRRRGREKSSSSGRNLGRKRRFGRDSK